MVQQQATRDRGQRARGHVTPSSNLDRTVTTTVPAPPPSRPAVELRAITGDDVGRVGQFLTAHLNPRVLPAAWFLR